MENFTFLLGLSCRCLNEIMVVILLNEEMQIVGVRVEDTENRVKWKTVIRCGDP